MSTSIAHRSGTLLSASPPRIRPRLIEGRSNSSDLCRANGSDSMLRKTSCALSTALSPSHGVAPWAATPATSSRRARTPFASTPIWRSVGSPVIAKSPMNPLSTRWSLPRSVSSSDSSSPTMPTRTRTRSWSRIEAAVELAGEAGYDVEVAVKHHRGRVPGPDLGPQHRQPADLVGGSLDAPGLEPALDEAGRFQHGLGLGGVVADQPSRQG